ncbi:MAG: phosphoglucosamine mutase [Acidimicrobiia bacterium]|nr:phosphoglucosamine mutase [Acidimicrobiia bacterium]
MLRFGTDGIRGDADRDLPTAHVRAVGRAAVRVLGTGEPFVIGRDTRLSGPRIEADLVAGIVAEGATAYTVGVLPTPGVAYLAATRSAPAAVISASHNPFADNGIKFFDRSGHKPAREVEAALESSIRDLISEGGSTPDASAVPVLHGGAESYVAHLVSLLEGRSLNGLRVVVDAANGAASEVAAVTLSAAGADVEVINASPDGTNINEDCGSTHPEALQVEVKRTGAAAGLALDGDADRVLAVDESGAVVDGDQIMAITALDLRERRLLRHGAVAVTVMSNLGLRSAMCAAGIDVVETDVGDRHVLAAMQERGLSLGGEQSGHVIFGDMATTGDGLLTGLMILDRMVRSGRPLSDLAGAMTRLPQVLESVRVPTRMDPDAIPALRALIEQVEGRLGDRGRVLVRPSGTEPVVRVMAEAPTEEEAAEAVAEIRVAVEVAARGT